MTVLMNDKGFAADDWRDGFVSLDALGAGAGGVDQAIVMPSSADPEPLRGLVSNLRFIRVDFEGFADGRVFTIARRLRLMGFQGRLRASGPLIADQYAMARRAGFDEVAIPDELASRQSEEQWLARSNWRDHDYQSRLRA